MGIDEILNREYQHAFISRGNNFPDFDVRKNNIRPLLVALHKDISIKECQNHFGFNDDKMNQIVALLLEKDWLHKINGNYKPTVFVATQEDGNKLYQYAKPISTAISKAIENHLSEIKTKFNQTDIAKRQSFDEWSFLILSNVLLDNWQIFHVENQFLGKNSRPLRHGKNYYAAIEEVTSDVESFGIYGNQYGQISVYGNNRDKADLTSTQFYVSEKNNQIFNEMAKDFLPLLIQTLESKKDYIKKVYEKSGYANEITFEEFFIWWYHFIYTQTTNELTHKGIIQIPPTGNFIYELEKF